MEQLVLDRSWTQLPAELSLRIASFLHPNDVACALRLVNKAAVVQFSGPEHTTVHLSQPVPPDAFARRWGAPAATRGLPHRQRLQFLCLTAASGSIPNMEVALEAAGCLPTGQVTQAAAAAGQRTMCEWLLQRGCSVLGALEAAAKAGQLEMCEWLIGRPHFFPESKILEAAAKGGHLGLMEWLVRTHPDTFRLPEDHFNRVRLLGSVAEGCDLATLQRLHREWLGAGQGGSGSGPPYDGWGDLLIIAAARSPTPDWRAKVEWLEGQGCPKTQFACTWAAAACPDAVERLVWLRRRGYPPSWDAAAVAACVRNLPALQYLHAEGLHMNNRDSTYLLATRAAEDGNLAAVAWLAEGVGVQLDERVFNAAAASGSLELLAWLRGRGCPWDAGTFPVAAKGGNEAALEWLAERGCPMGDDGRPYLAAFRNRDPATLRCLARLGCPWGPPGAVFQWVVADGDTGQDAPAMLRALLAAGCPVGCWEAAEALVDKMFGGSLGAELLAVLGKERARRGG